MTLFSSKRALHVLMTNYKIDSRVRNETNSLVREGMEVEVFCLKGALLPKRETRDGVLLRRFGVGKKTIITMITSWFGMIYQAMRGKFHVVHAHDITALPVGFVISRLKRIPLIYDSHELWSEAMHRDHPAIMIKIATSIERYLASRARHVLTVSDSISDYLKTYFRTDNVSTLRNVPSYTHEGEYDRFRKECGIDKDTIIFLYQGLISKSRGVNHVAEAALSLGSERKYKFIFLGDGPYTKELKQKINNMGLEDKILTLSSVSQDELLQYTSSADIGVHAIENTCLNHDFCLPNKLFEYILAGLAVVVTNLKEMSILVKQEKIGLTFEDQNVSDLAEKLGYLADNPKAVEDFKARSRLLKQSLTWNNESGRLLSVYKKVLG